MAVGIRTERDEAVMGRGQGASGNPIVGERSTDSGEEAVAGAHVSSID